MTFAMTREHAAAAVAATTAERDGIQANLLDLDGRFGQRMLAGAKLTGVSKHRWKMAAADLTAASAAVTGYQQAILALRERRQPR